MSSSIRRRKGDIGRMIFMRRLLVCCEMTSWAWRCGHALHAGVIVRGPGWDGEPGHGTSEEVREGFYIQRVGELFSASWIMAHVTLSADNASNPRLSTLASKPS